MSLNVINGGAFRDFEGQPLSSGYLIMELSHDEQDGGVPAQVVAGLKKRVPLDNNGNIAGTVSVEVNSTLTPANSYYIVNAYRFDGTKAWKAAQFVQVPASPSPYNVGNWVPTNPPGSSFSGGGETSILLETNGVPNAIQTIENLIAGTNVTLTADGAGGTTIAASGGESILLQTNGTNNTSQSKLNLVNGTNVTITSDGSGDVTINSTAGSGEIDYLGLENGVPDQTGNSFYNVASLTAWFAGHWEFITNTSSYVTFVMRLPHTVPASATILLELCCNDATAGHTANFTTSDAIVSAGSSFNVGSLTSASPQAFTTTSTAYARVTLSFAVQSSLSADGMLIIKVATSPTGTQPGNNILMFPYLKLGSG